MKIASTPCSMTPNSPDFAPQPNPPRPQPEISVEADTQQLFQQIRQRFLDNLDRAPAGLDVVVQRLAAEVSRICQMSRRIQASGEISHWQGTLINHRVTKCLAYYRLGSKQGRIDLHSTLSSIVYRHIAPPGTQLGFQGRYSMLEDFMQTFYIEVINAFRREHNLPETYTPRSRLELSEYMAFTEQYAKRRITIRGHQSQQLIVLRAMAFARRQPEETPIDMALVAESPKTEEAESHSRSSVMHQVREKLLNEAYDPGDAVMRERIVKALMQYLKEQNQPDCVDYLVLKLEDCSASEIDDILGISPRERDYLQQRFKYHIEKFAQHHEWELVHQWLGAQLDERLGMTPEEWTTFLTQLPPEQQQFIALKQEQLANPALTDETIALTLGWTPKKVQRSWSKIIRQAWEYRNRSSQN